LFVGNELGAEKIAPRGAEHKKPRSAAQAAVVGSGVSFGLTVRLAPQQIAPKRGDT
jgi:hypothetical protein